MAREVVKKVKVKGPKGKKGFAFLYDDGTIFIEFVRFSHPHIVTPWKKEGDKGPAKYSVQGMLGKDTHAAAIEMIEDRIAEILKEAKVKKLPSDRIFMRDGDESEDENHEGFMLVSAKETKRPPIRMRNGQPYEDRDEAEEDFVGGHWGAILIRPWWQNSKDWGKRVNCGLSSAQFLMTDETFGKGRLSEEELDDIVRSHDDDDDDGSYDDDDDDDRPRRKKASSKKRSRDDDDDDDDDRPARRKKRSSDYDDDDDDDDDDDRPARRKSKKPSSKKRRSRDDDDDDDDDI